MAIRNKLNIFDIVNLKDGGGALIKDPIKPNIETTSKFEQLQNAANNLTPKDVNVSQTPTTITQPHQSVVSTPQPTNNVITPVDKNSEQVLGNGGVATTPSERLKEIANGNITRIDDNGNEELVISKDIKGVKVPDIMLEGQNGMPRVIASGKLNSNQEGITTPTPQREEKPSGDSGKSGETKGDKGGTVDYESKDNPYKSRVDELQAIIEQMNADKKARDDEFEKQLAEKQKAYDDLKNNSIDLLKGNNDEAWREQKERFNQAALNYKSELDAAAQKGSMYYDNYLKSLGLYGSGAGAGLYNDMAVQNANAAMQIEANKQNQIENARQENTDRLMALLQEARNSGITLNDEEMKDILGTYSKDSLAAGTNAEATRWNRFSNLASAKKEQEEAEAKAQAELDNKDKVIANFASSMLEQGYTAEQIREAIKQFDDVVGESGATDSRTPTQRLLDATKVLEGNQQEQSQTGGKDELTLPEKQTQLANMKTVAEEQPDEFKAAITYYGTSLGSNPNTATGNTINTALDVVKNSQKMYTNAEFINDISLAENYFIQNADYETTSALNSIGLKQSDLRTPEAFKSEKQKAFNECKPILEEAFKAAKNGKLPDGTTIIPKRNKNDNYGVAYTYIGGYWYVGKCAWNADGVMTKEQLDKVIQ